MVPASKIGTPFRRALSWAQQKSDAGSQLRRTLWILLATILACGLPTAAQMRSNIAAVNLSAVLTDSISVLASPGQVNFALPPNGVATGNPTVTINTAWVLRRTATVSTYAYFSSSTAALSDGLGHKIPSSSVSGSMNGGPFQAFTNRCAFSANACVTVFTQRIRRRLRGRNLVGNNNSTVQLQISTVGLALPPGRYVGVLHIRAQAL